MRRTYTVLAALGCLFGVAGCSITGSWKRIATDPPGAPFPADHVTFGGNRNYTATWSHEGRTCISTGRYRWNGAVLDIVQAGSSPRSHRARRRLDGKLELTYKEGDVKVTAILAKTKR